jgi:hypothetical protein
MRDCALTVVGVGALTEPLHVADLVQMNTTRSSKHDAKTLAIQMEFLQCKSGTGNKNNLKELKMETHQSQFVLGSNSRNMHLSEEQKGDEIRKY